MSDIYVATRSFSAIIDGRRRPVRRGDHVRVGHPLLAGNEHMFTPLRVEHDIEVARNAPVEAATAAPGESRTTRRRSTTKTKSSEDDD